MPEGVPAVTGKAHEDGKLSDAARLQILSTEHWSLLATRSLSWSESFSRTSMFLSTLTGSVVALALVGQAMPGQPFVVFALLLLPVVLFLGVATYARLVAINVEDTHWVVGLNRIRHAYVELAPDVEQYFISGTTDDVDGVMKTFAARSGSGQFAHGFVTTPGTVAVIDGVLSGVLAGVVAGWIGVDLEVCIAVGAVFFVLILIGLQWYQLRAWQLYQTRNVSKFPGEPPAK